MKKFSIIVLLLFLSCCFMSMNVSAISGYTFETRVAKQLSTSAVSYGYDYLSYPSETDWTGIDNSTINFLFYQIPLNGNMLETQYRNAAYDIYTTGLTDTYGQLYNVDKKLVIPFPDFWNTYYKDVLGSSITSNHNSGDLSNFKMTEKLDYSKDYATKVTYDGDGRLGLYYLYTNPHQDQSVFYSTTKSWLPSSSSNPDMDSQYYIKQVVYHNPQSATLSTEMLRLAAEDPSFFMYLAQNSIQLLVSYAAQVLGCVYAGPAAPVCGVAATVVTSLGVAALFYLQQEKAQQEYYSATAKCDVTWSLRYLSGKWVQVPRCNSGLQQVIVKSSFLFSECTASTFYSFAANYQQTIYAPKYLEGYWSY